MAGIAGYRTLLVRQTPLAALAQRHKDAERRPRASLPPWPRQVDGKTREPESVSQETDDMDPNQTQVAATLGISLTALWRLMGNPQFPKPTSNDGVNISWSSATPINAFAALMTSAKANGWVVTVAAYPTADWAMMATTPIGPYYRPAASDPLFDL
jgi:predicted DNA-binding transcriptional regulator AlpA